MSDLLKQADALLNNVKQAKDMSDSKAFNYALKKKDKDKKAKGDKSGPTGKELANLKDPRKKTKVNEKNAGASIQTLLKMLLGKELKAGSAPLSQGVSNRFAKLLSRAERRYPGSLPKDPEFKLPNIDQRTKYVQAPGTNYPGSPEYHLGRLGSNASTFNGDKVKNYNLQDLFAARKLKGGKATYSLSYGDSPLLRGLEEKAPYELNLDKLIKRIASGGKAPPLPTKMLGKSVFSPPASAAPASAAPTTSKKSLLDRLKDLVGL